jgi:hypothetical protein
MKRLWLVCIVLALLSGVAKAQREDTVYALVFDEIAIAPTTSGLVRNIGQSSHLVTVILTDAPSLTCTSPSNVDLGMEYSYDGVTYIRAAGQITRVTANEDGILTNQQNVAGAYPWIRVNVRDFDTTNCRLTVNYSGAIAAFNVNNVAVTNSFLGIGAISTLASPSGLNIQYTPNTPTIEDINITNHSTFLESAYDTFDDSPWVKNDTVQASLTSAANNTVNCFTWLPGESTTVGGATFNAAASGTGYTGVFPNFFVQCDYNKATFATFMNDNNPLVAVTYNGGTDAFTFTPKVGADYDGFKGNALRITCVETSFCVPTLLQVGQWNRLFGGESTFTTQTTPQTLNGCVLFSAPASSSDNIQFFITPRYANCTTALQDVIRVATNRGVQVRWWIDDYQAFGYVFGSGVSAPTTGTTWGVGVPYIPPFVGSVTEFIWQWSDTKDFSYTLTNNWRTTVQPVNTISGSTYGASVAFNGVTYGQDELWLLIPDPSPAAWANTSGVPLLDAVLKFDVGGPAGTNTLIGQLWNAVYYQVNVAADTSFVFDGFTWNVYTNNNADGALLLRQN